MLRLKCLRKYFSKFYMVIICSLLGEYSNSFIQGGCAPRSNLNKVLSIFNPLRLYAPKLETQISCMVSTQDIQICVDVA